MMIAILSSLLLICAVVHALYVPLLLGLLLPANSTNGLKPLARWLMLKPYIAAPIWLYIDTILPYHAGDSSIMVRNTVLALLPFAGITVALIISYWNILRENRWSHLLIGLDLLHVAPLFGAHLTQMAAVKNLFLIIAIFYPMFFAITGSIIVRETPAPALKSKPKRRKKSPQLLHLADGEVIEIVEVDDQP